MQNGNRGFRKTSIVGKVHIPSISRRKSQVLPILGETTTYLRKRRKTRTLKREITNFTDFRRDVSVITQKIVHLSKSFQEKLVI